MLKPSRVPQRSGDLFALQPIGRPYFFGMVVGASLSMLDAPMPGSNLIYVYSVTSEDMVPADLSPDRLLIPPTYVNRQPWLKGYFQTVGHRTLTATDLLARHCFWHGGRRHFVDEHGLAIETEARACGDWSMTSYDGIDDLVSRAIGLPVAPRPSYPGEVFGGLGSDDIPEH